MRKSKDILVTTTSSLEGYEIVEYLKPITAHVVAGTNLFSDFLASFSDVFGGRSNTYQKQLASINEEAIERLKKQAQHLGGNGILGLKVDLDEISGKGKSMFMITAIGTAVVINYEKSDSKLNENSIPNNVSKDEISVIKRKLALIERAKNGGFTLDDDTLEFIIANQVKELYEYLINLLKKKIAENLDSEDIYLKFLTSYLSVLPDEFRIPKIYNSLSEENEPKVIEKLCQIIYELELLDFEHIDRLLTNTDFTKQKLALRILKYDKPFYSKTDITTYEQFIEKIIAIFPEKGMRTTKKQLLSSKEKDVWVCECKRTNDIGSYCEGCTKDIYGFAYQESTPPKTIALIEEKINIIKSLLERL